MIVGIVNYGTGNILSLENILLKCGYTPKIVTTVDALLKCDALILPGVGAFKRAINDLSKTKLNEAIYEYKKSGKLIIGICLGMQIMCTYGYESGLTKGLDLVSGIVKKLPNAEEMKTPGRFPLPKVGWYKVTWSEKFSKNSNLEDLGSFYYFVHSYYVELTNQEFCIGQSNHSEFSYCCAFQADNCVGIQFHPEKSSNHGVNILKKFIKNHEKY